MLLSYGTIAASPQVIAGMSFSGNSDLFQMQSLMFGISPKQIRNVQLAFTFPNDANTPFGDLYLFMPDTGELIAIPQENNSAVTLSVNILPSFQIQIVRGADSIANMNGNGILTLSTFERDTYWR
jgi:hypothetical protein